MIAYENILETYAAMAVKSAQMVNSAQHGNWDELVALEQDCSALIARLKRVDQNNLLPDAAFGQRKVAIIRKVLADDAEIRRHTEPWMAKLQAYLGSGRQELRLQSAYEAGGSQV